MCAYIHTRYNPSFDGPKLRPPLRYYNVILYCVQDILPHACKHTCNACSLDTSSSYETAFVCIYQTTDPTECTLS